MLCRGARPEGRGNDARPEGADFGLNRVGNFLQRHDGYGATSHFVMWISGPGRAGSTDLALREGPRVQRLPHSTGRPRSPRAPGPANGIECPHVSRRAETGQGRAVQDGRRARRGHPERRRGHALPDLSPGHLQVDLGDPAPPVQGDRRRGAGRPARSCRRSSARPGRSSTIRPTSWPAPTIAEPPAADERTATTIPIRAVAPAARAQRDGRTADPGTAARRGGPAPAMVGARGYGRVRVWSCRHRRRRRARTRRWCHSPPTGGSAAPRRAARRPPEPPITEPSARPPSSAAHVLPAAAEARHPRTAQGGGAESRRLQGQGRRDARRRTTWCSAGARRTTRRASGWRAVSASRG